MDKAAERMPAAGRYALAAFTDDAVVRPLSRTV
jgi:hypothetical protein